MPELTDKYVSDVISEEMLGQRLAAVGTLTDLVDTLRIMQTNIGLADFNRRWDISRRQVILEAIDRMADTKEITARTGETIHDVNRFMNNAKIIFAVFAVIAFISLFAGVSLHWLAGLGTFILLGALAFFGWPYIKLFVNNMPASDNRRSFR